MDRRLLRPGWMFAHLVVLAFAVLFVSLGLWQLDRLEERRTANETGEQRISAPPEPLEDLLASVTDLEMLQHRRVVVRGVFDASHEVLIRSQVHLGNAGFHVITPLVGESGDAVLVNRGWVPLSHDEVPVGAAPPPDGEVEVEGRVALSRERPLFGPEDPETGRLTTMSRVDVSRIADQVPMALAPVYVVEMGERGDTLPVPVDPPEFDDEGPHLGYAIQWFGFAVVAVAGYFFLARRRLLASG